MRIFIFIFIFMISANANDKIGSKNLIKNSENKILNNIKNKIESNFPRTEFTFQSTENSKPEYSILTVQPIHENLLQNNIGFFQGSVFRHDDGKRHTVNLGYGYRKFFLDKNLLLGSNFFYDNEFPHNHQQLGLGLEVRSSVFEINTNYYDPLTKWKSGEGTNLERAMKGYSYEVGGQLPYIPSAKVYFKSFKRDAIEKASDYAGNVYSLNFNNPVFPGVILEVGYNQINHEEDTNFIKISYNSELAKSHRNKDLKKFIDDKAFNFTSVEKEKLMKVRRENKIIKEVKSGGSNCSGLCFRVKGTL